ncbi:class I SAM-dependent methyltransferase [Magnetospirillum sulfuroxidans]|uniref:Class I SAM-dependent methyltransferase n=1 Tax=Magnetospirillum sulfuroxidans TaxID=611300 RepID=A0ABS5IE96_9PROT|nr:class I SAM-dependent methyltransferase [Magnetospirillum sulfuroxidans]MBR9972492.1 class I SAM-dependent methyltransferase [Magnetospirillum sulfuroxidans]
MLLDSGQDAATFSAYRAGFPESLAARLRAIGFGTGKQRVLDLCCGFGDLARMFAVGECQVVALDASSSALEQARHTCGGLNVEFVEAQAECTGLPDQSFDAVIAGQCWHWLERRRAAAEMARLVKPGGLLVICHFDWLPLPGNVVAATEEMIRKWNPVWPMGGGTGIYPQWLGDMAVAGFDDLETFSYDVAHPHTRSEWRARLRDTVGIAGRLSPQLIHDFDQDLSRMLDTRFPGEPLLVPHRVWAACGRRKIKPVHAPSLP